MKQEGDIILIQHAEINKLKWDQCVSQSDNTKIYAYSFYLDIMAEKWDALIMGDYQIVMPVTSNRKWGYQYLYQPAFTAQLGIFGKDLHFFVQRKFMNYVNEHFKWIEIDLNHGNHELLDNSGLIRNDVEILDKNDRYFFHARNNYVLDLHPSYDFLHQQYRPFIRKKIRDAHKHELTITKDIDFDSMMKVVLDQPFHQKYFHKKLQAQFRELYETLRNKEAASIYAVKNKEEDVIATAVFFFAKDRYYYILAASTKEGKKTGAAHFLIDHFIREHANENCSLDFEGSDKKELAFFYNSFGAILEPYPCMRKHELGKIIQWVKQLKNFIQS